MLCRSPCAFTPTLYPSFRDVDPAEWDRLMLGPEDIAMDRRFLQCFEENLAGQCRCRAVVFRDSARRAVASACLALFDIDALDAQGAFWRRLGAALRAVWPRGLRYRVLFCGLPAPAGHTHLRMAPGIDPDAIVRPLDEVLRQVARREGASMIVIKELDADQCRQMPSLSDAGYVRGELPPTYLLSRSFSSLEEYCRSQMGRYRRQTLRSMRKLARAGFEVQCLAGDEIVRRYDDAMHHLYEQVRCRAAYRLEDLTPACVREIARRLGQQASLILIHRDGRAGAWALCVRGGSAFYGLYCGLDYALNSEADLYFNLLYQVLNHAFSGGAEVVHLGQTADGVKARVGAVGEPRFFFVRAVNPGLHRLLGWCSRWVFPSIAPPEHFRVFHEDACVAGA